MEKNFGELKSRLENRPLVLYGAAKFGKTILHSCRKYGIEVTAFCDRAVTGRIEGIEIVDPESLKNSFPDAVVLVCSYRYYSEICSTLWRLGFPKERIVSPWQTVSRSFYAPPGESTYRSCVMIEDSALMFNGRIDTGERCLTLCCEGPDTPRTAFCESARDTVENFRRMRAELIAESVRFESLGESDEPRKFTAGCAKCPNFQTGDFGQSDGLIHFINLSMYPAPCQCKCVYCGFIGHNEFMRVNKRLHAKYYEKLFDAIDYAENAGYIAPDARWQVASGEITIHPYKKRILEWVKNRAAILLTNGFIFDEKIASILSKNPRASINLSLDSGTPETWRKVKGVDNFDTVLGNLMKYRDRSRPGQITLKYIVLPGMNDTPTDYRSFVEIMKTLDVEDFEISRDNGKKCALDAKAHETLICAASRLAAILGKNGMGCNNMCQYSPQEQERIVTLTYELLQAGAA
jgi:pyruvate-formate lyase-activating enzyme